MIRHIVMWKLAGDTPLSKQRNVERLTQSFLSLRGRIPGLLHLEIGVDSSGVDYACDVVLYSEDVYKRHHKTSPLSFVLVGRELIHHEVNEGSDFR